MKKITKYEAKDGMQFNAESECIEHEKILAISADVLDELNQKDEISTSIERELVQKTIKTIFSQGYVIT